MRKFKHKITRDVVKTYSDDYYISTETACIPKRFIENSNDWEEIIKKEVLLTTEDGVDLFEGDIYYFIWLSSPASCQKINTVYNHILEPLSNDTNWSENARFFAKKENAERYINLNSPKYTVLDMLKVANHYAYIKNVTEDRILKYLAKNGI